MKKLQIFAVFLVAVLSPWCSAKNAMARTPETETKLKGALANFQAVTPEMLQDPQNADLLQELRMMATDSDQTAARVPLIKLGDETVIESCLQRLYSERQKTAMNQLILACNPRVISLLARDFNREETAQSTLAGGDQLKFPVSMNAALIVKRTILKSPVFTREVKAWAKGLPEFSPDLRSGIRTWWELNKAALLRENYAAVVIPRP
jgi:hypothetical protein